MSPAFVKGDLARALVTLRPQRSPLLPEVPTATEAGLGALTIKPWASFFGPAGMPPEVVNRLSAELRTTLENPGVRAQLVQQGFEAYGMTPQPFCAFFGEIRRDV